MDSLAFTHGTYIWVSDEESVWIRVEVLESQKDNQGKLRVRVDKTNEERLLRSDDLLPHHHHLCNTGSVDCDDLTQLIHLHEPAVLHALHVRFARDQIYTLTGPILIAINPLKVIPGLYDNEVCGGVVVWRLYYNV